MGSSSDGDRPWQSYHTVYTNAKAGMDGVDKEKVQKTVYEMSKGSKYFENEQRKEAFIKQKIESLRAQLTKLTEKDVSDFQNIADRRILELEAERDLSRVWLHSDMDAFYAAVETLENPQLEGKPLAVGSMSMICTANYEARKFGVRAAMPGFIARKLCPELIFVPTNFEKYTYYSELTRKVFQKYDSCFIATSLDEAYLNITDICMERGVSGDEVATKLRNAIYEETGLTCSAGVAPNRLLAKVCSDINKPNGQYVLPNDRRAVLAFISSLPIRKIGGIGKVTENILKDVLGINNCEQMLQKSSLLCALFSHCSADFFLSVGLGLGGTNTPQFKSRKSMSNERTFSATDNEMLLFQKLEEIAESLSNDMHKESLYGRTITLKLKTTTFEVRTRAVSIHKYIQSKEDILSTAIKLLKAELPLSLRLIGLRMSQFQNGNHSFDTTQKTLRNFFTSQEASMRAKCDERSNCIETNDKKLMGLECDGIFFSDETLSNPNPFGSEDPGESSNSIVGVSRTSCSNLNTDEVHKGRNMEGPEKANNVDEISKSPILTVDATAAPSNQKDQLLWINDYICSLCGIELPPSFIGERQEHTDYHIAEMLQEEENKGVSRGQIGPDRITRRKGNRKEISHKRQKFSLKDSKYLPIDSFFIKSGK